MKPVLQAELGCNRQAEIQLFDPLDPAVRDLEEWNCSIHEKSVIEEVRRVQVVRRVDSV